MRCTATKLLSEVSSEIILSCDIDQDHYGMMHHDSIHDVYWPIRPTVREPLEAIHRKYVYEGAPLPERIAA